MASRPAEDAYDVGAAADLAVEPFGGVVRPDLSPPVVGEDGERQQVLAGVAEVVGHVGQPAFGVLQQPVELSIDGFRGGLVVDAAGASLSPPATCSWGGWP